MLDYLIDSIGTLALGLALLKREMLPAWSVLIMIAITITIRLTSQFVIKMSPLAKPHFVRDTRDIVTLMVCIGAIFSCWQHSIIDPGQRLVFDPPPVNI